MLIFFYITAVTKYDKGRMEAAIACVMQNRLKVPAAAIQFEVDRRSLWRKVRQRRRGIRSNERKKDAALLLTLDEELAVADYIRYREKLGIPLRRKDIRPYVTVSKSLNTLILFI